MPTAPVRPLLAFFACLAIAIPLSTPTSAAASLTVPQVASIGPIPDEPVGVGYPISVTFTAPVTQRAAAERLITFDSPKTPNGHFTWLDNHVVQWNPDGFWPAHSEIKVTAGGIKETVETGASVVGVADISDHTFTVSIDGTVARTMPASMGKPKHPTPTGSFTALEKQKSVIMDSRTIGIPLNSPEGYRLTVADAVRVTWGGVYVHGAPWSVASQGNANVSHGCINLSPDNAAWYYDQVHIGDPIIINA
jgi:lipoprotein-anchoring transpeptidase ErfK/SrfK